MWMSTQWSTHLLANKVCVGDALGLQEMMMLPLYWNVGHPVLETFGSVIWLRVRLVYSIGMVELTVGLCLGEPKSK